MTLLPYEHSAPILMKQAKLCGEYHAQHPEDITHWTVSKINRMVDNIGALIVANKHAGKRYPKVGRDQMTFLNTKLNDAQKKKFEDWCADEHVVAAAVTKCFHSGYKFSESWYADGEIFIVTMYPSYDAEQNAGYGLSSRAKDWYKGMLMCVYKHVVISGGDWSVFDTEKSDEG